MKKEKEGLEIDNEAFDIECTSAADFELSEGAMEFIRKWRSTLGEEYCQFIEDSYRGLSEKMQLVITHRFMSYQLYGDYETTGVKHADELLEKIIEKLPKDFADFLVMIHSQMIGRKMGIKLDYKNVN